MPYAATIGFFDGVHLGHQYLLQRLKRYADELRLKPMVVTFQEHPRQVLSGVCPPLLNTLEERRQLLYEAGAERVVVLPFAEVQPLTAQEFMLYLHNRYDVRFLLMGYDHRFGNTPSGVLPSHTDYIAGGKSSGIKVQFEEGWRAGTSYPSSSAIRRALETGDVKAANDILGRTYSITGTVVHGDGIGRTIDFPTANLQLDNPLRLIPLNGVYAVSVRIGNEHTFKKGIMNIGVRPTVTDGKQRSLEVYLPSFSRNLYGCQLTVGFLRRLRDERKFSSLQALREQIEQDIDSY